MRPRRRVACRPSARPLLSAGAHSRHPCGQASAFPRLTSPKVVGRRRLLVSRQRFAVVGRRRHALSFVRRRRLSVVWPGAIQTMTIVARVAVRRSFMFEMTDIVRGPTPDGHMNCRMNERPTPERLRNTVVEARVDMHRL